MLATARVICVRRVADRSWSWFKLEDRELLGRAAVWRFRSTPVTDEVLISLRSPRNFVRLQNRMDKVLHLGSGTGGVSRKLRICKHGGYGCRRQGRLRREIEQICQIIPPGLFGASPETLLSVRCRIPSTFTEALLPTLFKGRRRLLWRTRHAPSRKRACLRRHLLRGNRRQVRTERQEHCRPSAFRTVKTGYQRRRSSR